MEQGCSLITKRDTGFFVFLNNCAHLGLVRNCIKYDILLKECN